VGRAARKRRRKNVGFRKDDIIRLKDGRTGRIERFSGVPGGRRVAFITQNPDKTEPNPKCFTIPVDELAEANLLERIAWESYDPDED